MSAIGRAPLPKCIPMLIVCLDKTYKPADVRDCFDALLMALKADKPRKALNLRLARLARNRANFFFNIVNWLLKDEVKEIMVKKGALWAWEPFVKAFIDMDNGKTPHDAFGMNKSGAPKKQGFTRTMDAALLSAWLKTTKKIDAKEIRTIAIGFSEQLLPNDSEKVPDLYEMLSKQKIFENSSLKGKLVWRTLKEKYGKNCLKGVLGLRLA